MPSGIAYANIGSGNMNGTIGGAGALTNSITNNTPVGVTNVSGVSIINNGAGSSFVTVENNTIAVGDGFGIIANTQGNNSGTSDFHLLDNSVSVGGTSFVDTGISADNNSPGSAAACLNISGNSLATSPSGNADIVLANLAGLTFQVEQTAGTTNPPYDFTVNNQLVETDVQNAQTSAPGGTIVNPFATGSFTPGTCTSPSSP